jgi:hypothetical protein
VSDIWMRFRFTQPTEDYRPVKFPPPGPFWCSGSHGDESGWVLIAYIPIKDGQSENDCVDALHEYWPEAFNIDGESRGDITFTDRFPKPEWWK